MQIRGLLLNCSPLAPTFATQHVIPAITIHTESTTVLLVSQGELSRGIIHVLVIQGPMTLTTPVQHATQAALSALVPLLHVQHAMLTQH